MADLNTVTITGNLTRDPELRALPSGTSVCEMGVACNGRKKQGEEWVEVAHFFDVSVFGNQGNNCAQYLSKGKKVGVTGRLQYSSWEDKNGGGKRSKVSIVAHDVTFLTPKGESTEGPRNYAPQSDAPADTSGFGGAAASGQDDDQDIPF